MKRLLCDCSVVVVAVLHQGGFRIVKEADGTLRFVTADGRTIPRGGYRREDFVDEHVDSAADPSREGFCTEAVHGCAAGDEVREPVAVYRLSRGTAPAIALA